MAVTSAQTKQHSNMSPVLSPRSAPATASCFPRHALPRRHSVRHRSAPAGHHPRLGRTILCHHDGGTLWIIGRTAGSNPACVHAPRGLLHVLHHYNHPQVRNSSAISLAIASCTHDSGLALLTSPLTYDSDCVRLPHSFYYTGCKTMVIPEPQPRLESRKYKSGL